MKKYIFVLGFLLIVASMVLGGCSGTVDRIDNEIPQPPGLPDNIEEEPESYNNDNNLQPPSLPEE